MVVLRSRSVTPQALANDSTPSGGRESPAVHQPEAPPPITPASIPLSTPRRSGRLASRSPTSDETTPQTTGRKRRSAASPGVHKMSVVKNDPLGQAETTCGSLLHELQIIWDEVGENDTDRDKMLYELEQECLEVYRRKVDQANRNRAQLRQAIADSEAELAAICSAMGERPVHIRQADQSTGSLKAELETILPQLEEMRKRKVDRRNQFVQVFEDIQQISNEINEVVDGASVDESDLSLRKLEELHRKLHALQTEKNDRLKQVQDALDTIKSFCLVLGMEFMQTVAEIHPEFGSADVSKRISNESIKCLATAIHRLRELKLQRMQKLQDLATAMLELWNLMDTPIEGQQAFQNVTCNIAAAEHEITEPNTLSMDFLNFHKCPGWKS